MNAIVYYYTYLLQEFDSESKVVLVLWTAPKVRKSLTKTKAVDYCKIPDVLTGLMQLGKGFWAAYNWGS